MRIAGRYIAKIIFGVIVRGWKIMTKTCFNCGAIATCKIKRVRECKEYRLSEGRPVLVKLERWEPK